MRRIIMGCTMAGMIVLSPKAGARQPVASIMTASCLSTGAECGIASWYGARHHGRWTASGERFDKEKMTAAHRTLPLGTRISVTNLRNGRSVVLRINDRGPGIPGRIVDVSLAAARRLGFIYAGLIPVQIDVISYPKAKYTAILPSTVIRRGSPSPSPVRRPVAKGSGT